MFRVHYHCVDSTNSRAADLARLNPHRPLLVSARTQNAGRGRHGRQWLSPPGGAWFSVAWPMQTQHPDRRVVPVVVGLAIAEALEAVLAENGQPQLLSLKWPNDVLIGDAKVCGILCEQTLCSASAVSADVAPATASRASLIIGVGINVNLDPTSLAAPLRMKATSLKQTLGMHLSVMHVINLAACALQERMRHLQRHGFDASLHDAVTLRLAWRDQRVVIQGPRSPLEGWIRGINDQGELLLETAPGQCVALAMGEVEKVRPVNAAQTRTGGVATCVP